MATSWKRERMAYQNELAYLAPADLFFPINFPRVDPNASWLWVTKHVRHNRSVQIFKTKSPRCISLTFIDQNDLNKFSWFNHYWSNRTVKIVSFLVLWSSTEASFKEGMINIGALATASARAPSHLCQCMYAFLSDTYFFYKDVLGYYKREFFFVFFFLCIFFLREEPHFSCKLLTWNPGTMQMWLKRIVFPSLSPFFNIKHERLQSQFSKV